MDEYRSNSHKLKEGQTEKKIEKVISGSARQKKKNEIQKLANIFAIEDIGNVGSYIISDILIPTIKKSISDIVTNGIDMILYGETGRNKKNSTASKISYDKNYYDKNNDRRERNSFVLRNSYDYDNIIFENRGEAESVLSRIDELIDIYGLVSVADFYDLAGITGSYTDNKYGWYNVRNASIIRTKDGYIIKLPKALPL